MGEAILDAEGVPRASTSLAFSVSLTHLLTAFSLSLSLCLAASGGRVVPLDRPDVTEIVADIVTLAASRRFLMTAAVRETRSPHLLA